MKSSPQKDHGKLLASYSRPERSAWQRAGLVILALMVVAFIGLGVNESIVSVQTYGPAAAFTGSKAWYLAAGIGLIFLVGAWAVSGTHGPGAQVFERALVLSGEEKNPIRWTTIAGVIFREQQYRLGRVTYDARLLLNDGQQVDLTNWLTGKRLVDLVVHIKARTYRRLDEALRNQIMANGWADFGPVAVGQAGVKIKGSQFEWQSIRRVRIANGVLCVEAGDHQTIEVGVEKVSNPELLMHIVKDFGGNEA